MKKIILLLLSISFIHCQSQDFSKKWTDINYAGDDKAFHTLDIYLPKIAKTNYPVVVLIYGSAWMSNSGKGSDMNTLGSALLNAGYAVVTPNHRSSSDTLYPGQIHDIKATIRYIRANCQQYQLDTTFIGITGSSSGGHLAALAGTTNNVHEYTIDSITMDIEGNLGNCNEYSSNVDAVCDWFGPTDMLIIDSCRGSSFGAPGQTPEELLIGENKSENKSKFMLVNPITFIDSTDSPFLIFHGDADVVVPYCESEVLFESLKQHGVQSEYIIVPGGQHYTGVHISTYITKMIEFFNTLSGNSTISGVKQQTSSKFKVYPNPTGDKLNIEYLTDSFYGHYQILNLWGQVVSDGLVLNNQVDVSEFDKGCYLIRLIEKDGNSYMADFIKL